MLETFEIADSSSSAKDESTLEVAGAVGVDITSSSVDVVKSPIEATDVVQMFSSGGVKTVAFD